MESRVIFHADMDNDPADFTNLQDFVQGSMEHVVADGITNDRKYAGFAAAATGVTTLTVQPGRFYSEGKVYNRESTYVHDFTTNLPVATKRIASLVVYGSEVDTDSRPRDFLINAETNAVEPRVVAMERARIANINVVFGQENADPLPPVVDSGVIVVATIVLLPSGIQSVTMATDTAIDSVKSVSTRTKSLEAFRDVAAPQIISLASDIAALTKGQKSTLTLDQYGRTLARLAVLEAQAGIPAAAVDSSADYFLDTRASDLAFSGSQVKVEEGIRFADEAANVAAINIFNALNPAAKIVGGVMFPAYSRAKRFSVGAPTGEVQVSSYSYQTNEMVQKTASRIRVRYGPSKTVCTNSAWWKSGQYDATTKVFRLNGETWTIDPADYALAVQNHKYIRVTQFWQDSYEEPYWDAVTISHSVAGAQVAETFLNSNDMWLDAVGLTFTRLAASGTVTVAICETERGLPMLDRVISKTTVDRAALSLNAETVIPVQPVFLTGGERYAIVVISAADHWLGTVQGSAYPQGTFFYVLDGAYQQGDATRDIAFSLYAAQFSASRAVIDLQPLSLSGGIVEIDLIAPAIIPGATSLDFEVQVNSVWQPLASVDDLVLGAGGNIPPLLPFRAVFTGTPDVMPALTLTDSQVTVARPRTTLRHISTVRTLPGSGSDAIRVIARLEYFESAHHTATCKILRGAGYTTVEDADSVVDETMEDGSIERTWVFDIASGDITSYRIRMDATTDSALNVFHFGWRKDYAI